MSEAEQLTMERQFLLDELAKWQKEIRKLNGRKWEIDTDRLSQAELLAVIDYEKQRARMMRVGRK